MEYDKINFKRFKKSALVILIVFLMWLSFGAGIYLTGKSEVMQKVAEKEIVYLGKLNGKYSEADSRQIIQDIDFDLFWQVWDTIKENYVDREELSDKMLFYGALKGLVNAVGDPYTVFMDPKISKEFEDDLKGTFEGIGAEIGIKNNILTIIAPLPDMPAEKAGLKPGDKVLAINDESTMGMPIDVAVSKIRGEKGTDVTLSIVHRDSEDVEKIKITRGQIIVASVRTEILDGNMFLIEISNFNSDTEQRFNNAVREAIAQNPKGIIIDLRSNPGGYLDTAIEMASEWVESNIVVTEKYNEEQKIEHLSRGRARLKDFNTIVLVNEGSASASEIVAGALQDYGLAKIVGKKTFGKGSVQSLNNFSDGSSLKITVAKWLTPSGRSISDEGIEPNIEIDLTREDYNADKDPQLEMAIEIINNNMVIPEIATSSDEQVDIENK